MGSGISISQEPFRRGAAITKSDDTVYNPPINAVYVGGAGAVAFIGSADSAAVTLAAVPVGTILPIEASKIMSTNTTATLLIGLYR